MASGTISDQYKMTRGEFTGVTFNDLDPSGTRISWLSEFSITEIVLNILHKAHVLLIGRLQPR